MQHNIRPALGVSQNVRKLDRSNRSMISHPGLLLDRLDIRVVLAN
jgi:hypothetical protein